MKVSTVTQERSITIVLSEPEAYILYRILTTVPAIGCGSDYTADFQSHANHPLYNRIVGHEKSLWDKLDNLNLRG